MSNLKWQLIDKQNEQGIEEIYQQVFSESNYPAANQIQFLTPLIKLFFTENDLIHAALFQDKKPIYVFPIVRYKRKKFGISWWELGFPFHNHINLTEIPSELSGEVFKSLIELLKQHFPSWSRFAFRNIQINNANMEYAGDVAWFNTECDVSTIVSKKHLRNIRRLEKKLISNVSNIYFKLHDSSLEQPLLRFSNLEQASWKGEDGIAINSDEKTKRLYQAYSRSDSNMLIAELWDNENLIAAAIGFKISENLYIHKISHNPSLNQFAPGNILILKLLEHAVDSANITKLNLVTRPNWVNRWHPRIDRLFNYIYYRNNIKGKFLQFIISRWRWLKPHIKSILNPVGY